jgi:hypothetical protein
MRVSPVGADRVAAASLPNRCLNSSPCSQGTALCHSVAESFKHALRSARGDAIGEIRDCDPPVKTCFAVGAVLRVCEVFRFLLEHRSLGVTLVVLLLVRAGSVISRRVLVHGRDEAGAVSIFAVEVSIACAA